MPNARASCILVLSADPRGRNAPRQGAVIQSRKESGHHIMGQKVWGTAVSLTEGNIGKSLALFSVPMILGNLLQQLYNVADTFIVGKTIGPGALSAVGSSYALMVLLTSIILGLCMGSGVVFSQLFGAGKLDELKEGAVNSFVFIFLVSAAVNIGAFLLLDPIIRWLHIPPEAADMTREYLGIIFWDILPVFIYNFFSALLRSIGDTVTPLLVLAVSAVTNIGLDVYGIVVLGLGVAGAAWATVAAQTLSAVCITAVFLVRTPHLRPAKKHVRFNQRLLGFVMSNSILSAVQQSIMNFGILMIQGLVNSFGLFASSAFAAAVKIDAFAYMPVQDFGNAFSTFVAQNVGARQPERIRRGCKTAGWMSVVFCILASMTVWVLAEPLLLLFVRAEEVEILAIGVQYLHIEGACYAGIGILFLLYGYYRGLGRSGMSIVLTVVSLGSRVALAYALSAVDAIGLTGIWWSVPIGWFLADALGIGYMLLRRNRADKPEKKSRGLV